jgi:hypothetical protein
LILSEGEVIGKRNVLVKWYIVVGTIVCENKDERRDFGT